MYAQFSYVGFWSNFGSRIHLLSYCVYEITAGSSETVRMRRLIAQKKNVLIEHLVGFFSGYWHYTLVYLYILVHESREGSGETAHWRRFVWALAARIWATTRETLSSGFPTKWDSNQSPQLYWDQLENCNFARSKSRYHGYDTFQKANNKCADQNCCSQTPESRFSRVETNMW